MLTCDYLAIVWNYTIITVSLPTLVFVTFFSVFLKEIACFCETNTHKLFALAMKLVNKNGLHPTNKQTNMNNNKKTHSLVTTKINLSNWNSNGARMCQLKFGNYNIMIKIGRTVFFIST